VCRVVAKRDRLRESALTDARERREAIDSTAMTTVADVNDNADVDVQVVDDDDEDLGDAVREEGRGREAGRWGKEGGERDSGGESVGSRWRARVGGLGDSVVARLLMDSSRPPRVHAGASTTRRDAGVEHALRSLPPPVDLSAEKSVCIVLYILKLVAWHSRRTSVSDWRTFPVLRSTCS